MDDFGEGFRTAVRTLYPVLRPARLAIGALLLSALIAVALFRVKLPTAAAAALVVGALVGSYYAVKVWGVMIHAAMKHGDRP